MTAWPLSVRLGCWRPVLCKHCLIVSSFPLRGETRGAERRQGTQHLEDRPGTQFILSLICYVTWQSANGSLFPSLRELSVLKGAEQVNPCCWDSHLRAGPFKTLLGICTCVLCWSLRDGRRTNYCCFSQEQPREARVSMRE